MGAYVNYVNDWPTGGDPTDHGTTVYFGLYQNSPNGTASNLCLR